MPKKKPAPARTYVRIMVYAVIAILLVALVVRQRNSFEQAINVIQQSNPGWLAIGILAMVASLPATALVYMSLSPKKLQFFRTVLVQAAGFCINKLLPSGSGAAGTSFLYLRAQKLTNVQAGSIVVLNNAIGLVGHFLLFWVFIALQPDALQSLNLPPDTITTGLALFAAAIILTAGLGIVLRDRLHTFTQPVMTLVKTPKAILQAVSASMLITMCYTVSLYASAAAVGIHITLTAAIIVLSASVLASSVVPTPGGIGAAEAGAYGGLLAFGVQESTALAAALLFRVCTFWVPLLIGSVCFAFVAKRGYLRKAS